MGGCLVDDEVDADDFKGYVCWRGCWDFVSCCKEDDGGGGGGPREELSGMNDAVPPHFPGRDDS